MNRVPGMYLLRYVCVHKKYNQTLTKRINSFVPITLIIHIQQFSQTKSILLILKTNVRRILIVSITTIHYF